MKLGLHQSARLEQRMMQSPQMIQAMQILQLPTADLEQRIEQELQENPFLELREQTPLESEPAQAGSKNERERLLETLDQMERSAGELRLTRKSQRPNREAADQRYEALQNAPDRRFSLSETLISPFHLLDLNAKQRAVGEYIIYSLDDRGYFSEPFDAVVAALGPEVSPAEVEQALRLVQELGPPGIGARNLQECLLLQIAKIPGEHELARLLVEKHLEDIQANRLPKIAKEIGRSISEIKEAIEFLRHLDPRPGAHLGGASSESVHPDVVVEEIDGKYELRFERGTLPELQISPTYREMLQQAKGDARVQEFLKRRIESAKAFIDAIHQRQSTVEKISREILRRQKDFFDHGREKLRPLRMQDVADEVGVHISTVSRAIAGKYIQTPHGIFDLKFFFTGGTMTDSGEVESQTAIKEKIVEIVHSEDPRHPLSDDDIAKVLLRNSGVPIARRTVTKYRKTLKIPPSNLRRQY